MTEGLLAKAKQYRDLVLLVELAGWLHDLGKLSSGFARKHGVAYNPPGGVEAASKMTGWQHEQVFSEDEQHLGDLKDMLRETRFTGPVSWLGDEVDWFGSSEQTLWSIVERHHRVSWDSLSFWERTLKRADGDDSGEDEYGAVSQVKQGAGIWQSTVFGTEMNVAVDSFDELRSGLYRGLAEELGRIRAAIGDGSRPGSWPAASRERVWELLKAALGKALGKTQRAANDVRLDQHVWAVSARLKAFVLRDLVEGHEPTEHERGLFRLLSICWDWWRVTTPFARLSDVVGRDVMVVELRDQLRRLVEADWALGNHVYQDDSGVHFLVANLEWPAELAESLRATVNHISGGELQSTVLLSDATDLTSDLGDLMDVARKELPIVGRPTWVDAYSSPHPRAQAGDDVAKQERPADMCPVCQLRPLSSGASLCEWCAYHRGEGVARRLASGRGTVWTGEIADGTGRAALVLARFDLRRWLTGEMLHSMFITSPRDLAHAYPDLEASLDWQHLLRGVSEYVKADKYDQPAEYQQRLDGLCEQLGTIKANAAKVRQAASKGTDLEAAQDKFWLRVMAAQMAAHEAQRGLYVHRTAERLAHGRFSKEDALLLALARKNPSASRLLRVWQTTEEFLSRWAKALPEQMAGHERQRVTLTLDQPLHAGIHTAEVSGWGELEFFVKPRQPKEPVLAQTITWVKDADEAAKHLAGHALQKLRDEGGKPVSRATKIDSAGPERYYPYQVITTSPNLLLAMVPADQAMKLAAGLRAEYETEFGKVQGRLPFHVGLVFMDAHYPMFAALDTARRLVEVFDQVAENPAEGTLADTREEDGTYLLDLTSGRFGAWQWRVPSRRGDGATDWYHPYFCVKAGADLEKRGMSVNGPHGRWVHVSQLQKGDCITFWPNLFDFVMVDTVSRRLDARVEGEQGRRPHALLGVQSPRPYLLERVDQLEALWHAICYLTGMSESRLQACHSLLAGKWRSWHLDADEKPLERAAWDWLAQEVVNRDLDGDAEIAAAVADGLFFDSVELYRHILKREVKCEELCREEVSQ